MSQAAIFRIQRRWAGFGNGRERDAAAVVQLNTTATHTHTCTTGSFKVLQITSGLWLVRWVDGWEGIGTSKRIKGLSKTRSGFPIGPPLFSNGSNRRWRRLATATRLFLLLFFFFLFQLACQKKGTVMIILFFVEPFCWAKRKKELSDTPVNRDLTLPRPITHAVTATVAVVI